MFAFGVVEGDAEYFSWRRRLLENSSDFDALIAVDGFYWVGFMFVHSHTRLKINLERGNQPEQPSGLDLDRPARLLRTCGKATGRDSVH